MFIQEKYRALCAQTVHVVRICPLLRCIALYNYILPLYVANTGIELEPFSSQLLNLLFLYKGGSLIYSIPTVHKVGCSLVWPVWKV